MINVVRWGRSAYESDADLSAEAHALARWDASWRIEPDRMVAPALDSVDILVVNSKVRVGSDVFRAMAGKLVITTTSGVDHLDLRGAAAWGVTVARCPQARGDAVAEYTLWAIEALLRRIGPLQVAARDGRWARESLPSLAPRRLIDANVFVVGHGVIGRKVSAALLHRGAHVRGCDPRGVSPGVTAADLSAGLSWADAVTLHCDLNEATAKLIDADAWQHARSGVVLVNTARGGLVCLDALRTALNAGTVRGAALDVFESEPYADLRGLATRPDVWLTPHSSGYVRDLGVRLADEVGATVGQWLATRTVPFPVGGRVEPLRST